MPQEITLEEIARTNPHVDLEKLAEMKRMRAALVERGLSGRARRSVSSFQDDRAKIVDDADSDPRLTRLTHRY